MRTLLRRAETVITEKEDRKEEVEHVKRALTANGYQQWAFHLPKKKEKNDDKNESSKESTRKFPVALPYVAGLSEKLQRIFKTNNVPAYHKPYSTLRSLLVKPKDKTEKEK